MSISSMTNVALDRKVGPPRRQPSDAALDRAADAARGGPEDQSAVTKALDVVVAYIPSELLTLYVAVMATLGDGTPVERLRLFFLGFLVATPVVVWTLYAGKFRASQKRLPLSPGEWPKWEMVAGTVAFAVWAYALPDSPLTDERALAGLAVVIVSVALGLAALLFAPLPSSAPDQ